MDLWKYCLVYDQWEVPLWYWSESERMLRKENVSDVQISSKMAKTDSTLENEQSFRSVTRNKDITSEAKRWIEGEKLP
jgi:hypothetical protein